VRVLGIDPGAGGAIALLCDGSLTVLDMPSLKIRRGKSDKAEVDGYTLGRVLSDLRPDVAYIELVGGFQGQSASSAFNFGRAAGAPEYVLMAQGVRVERVAPGRWKRALALNGGKDGARAAAMRLWPASAALFKRVMDTTEPKQLSSPSTADDRKEATVASSAEHDAVNHPKHYTQHPSGVECIQIVEHPFCKATPVSSTAGGPATSRSPKTSVRPAEYLDPRDRSAEAAKNSA
jgi:Holliday junction resolvasome RuvABC endonuclease subunit